MDIYGFLILGIYFSVCILLEVYDYRKLREKLERQVVALEKIANNLESR